MQQLIGCNMALYFDHASTTPLHKEVLDAMFPYLKEQYANPSSMYDTGIQHKKVLNQSRKKVAELLNCSHKEIHFTSGGSEANNWAIKGLAYRHPDKKEIITTSIEHHSVLRVCEFMERLGYTIHYLEVDAAGFVNLDQLKKLISDKTLLVSIIFANNEIGTIQDIGLIAKICKKAGVFLHTDATQAICHLPIDLKQLDVDLLSFSAHKFYGPKGIGCLYIREGIEVENLIHGGQQENHRRAGTENLASIIGLTKALEIGMKKLKQYDDLRKISQLAYEQVKKNLPAVLLNGPEIGEKRLASNLHFSFHGVDGMELLYELNKKGVYVSTGSACDSETIEPSHVLKAIGVSEEYIEGSIRISFGLENTVEEINEGMKILIETVKELME
jgi:cysteine desulfurase